MLADNMSKVIFLFIFVIIIFSISSISCFTRKLFGKYYKLLGSLFLLLSLLSFFSFAKIASSYKSIYIEKESYKPLSMEQTFILNKKVSKDKGLIISAFLNDINPAEFKINKNKKLSKDDIKYLKNLTYVEFPLTISNGKEEITKDVVLSDVVIKGDYTTSPDIRVSSIEYKKPDSFYNSILNKKGTKINKTSAKIRITITAKPNKLEKQFE